jgi:serine/threonine-protein kinase RsbW
MTLKAFKAYELTIASRLEELDEVRHLVDRAAKDYKLGDDLAYWMELTVTESMINAIRHGNKLDPSKVATLRISSDGYAIEIIVEDQGTGFSLDDLADPRETENLLKPTGRGILIIRSFMDEVALSAREGGGSRLRMVKRIEGVL